MRTRPTLSSVVVLALVASWSSRAAACGGFFCSSTPVVQAGEQIVYGVQDDGSLVMSVRIAYQGAAPGFAWILPVPVEPTIELGTNALFVALDGPTRPSFQLETRVDGTCASSPVCAYPDAGLVSSDAGASRDAASSGTVIYSEGTLGPYETVVLGATSGAEARAWLTDHGYIVTADAIPVLDAYAAHGDRFVALRLRTDASVAEIQPITLRMARTPPCLPIRLTAIATQPDLPITAFVLGGGRAVPTNYSIVDAMPTDPGLWGYDGAVTSYASWVTREVDALGGHAFITDYAGATPAVRVALCDVLDLATASPHAFVAALVSRGYAADSQFLPLLTRYLVPPSGWTAPGYYNCLLRGDAATCPAPATFDPSALAAAIDLAITQPRIAADALTDAHPYTTRLFTTMSADEMTLDPELRLDPALGDVASVHVATRVFECDAAHYLREAATHLELANGGVVGARAAVPHATADAYCGPSGHATGETYEERPAPIATSSARDAGGPPPPCADAGAHAGSMGCTCSAGTFVPRGGCAVLALVALLVGARIRRRAQPRIIDSSSILPSR
jgi:hypothetical protein